LGGGRPLSTSELLLNLKLYGKLAGVPEEKLTLMALRRTAMRLRLDEGEEGEMRVPVRQGKPFRPGEG